MRKKLAFGLSCALLCGLNLVYTRSLEGQKVGDCFAYECMKHATCVFEVACAFCMQPAEELPGVCFPY